MPQRTILDNPLVIGRTRVARPRRPLPPMTRCRAAAEREHQRQRRLRVSATRICLRRWSLVHTHLPVNNIAGPRRGASSSRNASALCARSSTVCSIDIHPSLLFVLALNHRQNALCSAAASNAALSRRRLYWTLMSHLPKALLLVAESEDGSCALRKWLYAPPRRRRYCPVPCVRPSSRARCPDSRSCLRSRRRPYTTAT